MLVEFEVWHDCPNHCTFCALGVHTQPTSDEYKIENIHKVLDIIDTLDWNKYDEIGLIGGELLQPLNETVEEEFLKIIDKINTKNIKKCYIMSSLLNESTLLKKIVDRFTDKSKLMINTSWDKLYRFNENKEIWYKNIEYLVENGIQIHYETILTNGLIKSFLNNDEETVDMLSLNNVDIIRPSQSTGRDIKGLKDFFPTRKNFIQFLEKLKQVNNRLYDELFSLKKRASTMYIIPLNMKKDRDYSNYIEDSNETPNTCGHSKLYQCYSDSDKCIICDTLKYKELL